MLDEFNSVKQRAPFQWVIHEGFDQQHLLIEPRDAPAPDGTATNPGYATLNDPSRSGCRVLRLLPPAFHRPPRIWSPKLRL